jgi:hypothetical protein
VDGAATGASRAPGTRPLDPDDTRPPARRRWWPPVLCSAIYLVLAMLEFGHLNELGGGYMAGFRGEDQIAQVWWIAWAQFALAHGLNPLYTNWQNYPAGFNAGVNGSVLALGVVFSPVTSLFGAVVTWNILLRLALAASALSMCLVLRRWTRWWPAAFVGGLLYGFSAYSQVQGNGYLFLAFVPLPPLLFLLLDEALVRQRWRPTRVGVLFALVGTVQFFISTEILASSMVMCAVACLLYLGANRKALTAAWPYMKRAGRSALIAGALLLAVPVTFTLVGPQAILGPPNSPAALASEHGDLVGLFLPSSFERLSDSKAWASWEPHLIHSTLMYVGLPFLVAVGLVVYLLRRRGIVVMAGALAAVALVLSLGSVLYVGGHDTHVPLPFVVLAHLPITDGFLSTRFSLFTVLFGAAIVALGIEALHRRILRSNRWDATSTRWKVALAAGVPMIVALIVALPLLPSSTLPTSATDASSFFTSPGARSNIPVGSAVLAYPYAGFPEFPASGFTYAYRYQSINNVVVDQAVAHIRFRLIGGFDWRPAGNSGSANPTLLPPASVQALFDLSFYGSGTPAQYRAVHGADLTSDLRVFARRHRVGTVVVFPLGQHPATVVSQLTAALGPPTHADGTTVWYHVQHRLAEIAASS